MRPAAIVGWLGLALSSVTLSWAAWRQPPPDSAPPPPPALPRQPGSAERSALREAHRRLQQELDEATRRLGRPPTPAELEAPGPDGAPLLPSGLPDNPLRPGIAAVVARCPAVASPIDGADWIYCPDDGQVDAVGLP